MSKEKQCECCHEWWYDSDVKENLCPNCYDYFKQLKQQLAEKDKEIKRLKEIKIFKDSRNMTTKINGVDFSDEQIITLQNLDVLKRYDQTRLAIQELEKTLNFIENVFDKALKNCSLNNVYYDQILDFIDQQIKELKGEKDE